MWIIQSIMFYNSFFSVKHSATLANKNVLKKKKKLNYPSRRRWFQVSEFSEFQYSNCKCVLRHIIVTKQELECPLNKSAVCMYYPTSNSCTIASKHGSYLSLEWQAKLRGRMPAGNINFGILQFVCCVWKVFWGPGKLYVDSPILNMPSEGIKFWMKRVDFGPSEDPLDVSGEQLRSWLTGCLTCGFYYPLFLASAGILETKSRWILRHDWGIFSLVRDWTRTWAS